MYEKSLRPLQSYEPREVIRLASFRAFFITSFENVRASGIYDDPMSLRVLRVRALQIEDRAS